MARAGPSAPVLVAQRQDESDHSRDGASRNRDAQRCSEGETDRQRDGRPSDDCIHDSDGHRCGEVVLPPGGRHAHVRHHARRVVVARQHEVAAWTRHEGKDPEREQRG